MAAIFESSSSRLAYDPSLASREASERRPGAGSRAIPQRSTNGPSEDDTMDGEMGDQEQNNDGEKDHRPKRAKLNKKLACVRCRNLKAKCEPQEPPNGKCARCTRLSFDCVWVESQKRGPKTSISNSVSANTNTNSVGRPPERAPQGLSMDDASLSSQHGALQSRPASDPLVTDTSMPLPVATDESLDRLAILASAAPSLPLSTMGGVGDTSAFAAPDTPSRQQSYAQPQASTSLLSQSKQHVPQHIQMHTPVESSPHSDAQRSYNQSDSLRDDTSPRSVLPSLSMMDLAQAKEKALRDMSATGPVPTLQRRPTVDPRPEPDPIDMHVLSELDAKQLFEHYHAKMNAFIILLDPFLHSPDYVRKTSPVLFSTMLAVSAKFIRPRLYPPLLMHAKQLTGRAIIDGKVSIGLIQSMLMQVYWKEPDDTSAWLRVGEAIRMGYQLHLHYHRPVPLPDDEMEARLILDRERTWIDLCAFDQTFFLQSAEEEDGFHQTCMIPHYRINVQSWLRETRHFGVEDDLEQGANFEWIKMQRLSKDILKARPGNARALSEHVRGTLEAAYHQYLDPSSDDAFVFETRPWIRVNFWLAAASLAVARAVLTAVGMDGDLLARWVVASGAFVDALEIIARHGYIQYWQDTLGITLYSMGEFSVKIFSKVNSATQRAIVGWLERIYRACELCADGQTESTAAFISRFFQLCLRAVCSPNTTPESSSHPGNTNHPRISNNLQAIQNSQPSDGLLDSMHAPLIGFHDASYWESIFPGLSTDWSWLLQSLEDGMRTS